MSSVSSSSHGDYSVGNQEAVNGRNLDHGRITVTVEEANLFADARNGLNDLVLNG